MILDRSQQEIVDIRGERALVLAGPGCGKTHILAQRIIAAHGRDDVAFDDMVCLTFTNRASREMKRRIEAECGYSPDGLFVGNLHRFCIRMLYARGIIDPDISVIDEDDRDAWLSESLGLHGVGERNEVTAVAMMLFEQENSFPLSLIRRPGFDVSQNHIRAAKAYIAHKRDNRLIDFDDVLLLAYKALSSPEIAPPEYGRYHWVQVDEVQDLTPLQLAIVDLITAIDSPTVLYLGDEQQAIFEFTGAGGPALDKLKRRCEGHIYRLRRNYRSPAYLVNLCNAFAMFRLGIDPSDLPTPDNETGLPGALRLLPTRDMWHDYAVAAAVRRLTKDAPDETVAVLVRTNDEAETISSLLGNQGIEHMLIARRDLFKRVPYKTVCAHFAVTTNPARMLEWSRILYQTRSVATMREAQSLVSELRLHAATPADLMTEDGKSAVGRLVDDAESGMVVFDTETSGLDVFEDDILQIAAVKIKGGKVVKGSAFNIFIDSRRQPPATLADGQRNPLVEALRLARRVPAREALEAFARYVGDMPVCGHNVGFDLKILRNNFRRHAPELPLPAGLLKQPTDTLLTSRLLFSGLRSYTLGNLIRLFGLKGTNSHLADDDAEATAILVEAMLPAAREKAKSQKTLFANSLVAKTAMRLNTVYGPLCKHTRATLDSHVVCPENTLCAELDYTYKYLCAKKFIQPIDRWDYVMRLIDTSVSNNGTANRLDSQLAAHYHDLQTFNEGDMLANDIVRERVSVMTVHKAKGLEMDNVIVYDARHLNWGRSLDKARVFYVAFSRAKRRLWVFHSSMLSESVGSVAHLFDRVAQVEVEASALTERLNRR